MLWHAYQVTIHDGYLPRENVGVKVLTHTKTGTVPNRVCESNVWEKGRKQRSCVELLSIDQ